MRDRIFESRYIIGTSISGYARIKIDDVRQILSKAEDGSTFYEFVIVLADKEDVEQRFATYYSSVSDMLVDGHKVVLIGVGNGADYRKIGMLMALYEEYNIYRIETVSALSAEYLRSIEARKPDHVEVSLGDGGWQAGFGLVNRILIGLSSLAKENNVEGMLRFVGEHVNEIDSIAYNLDMLRETVRSFNKDKIEVEMNDLRNKLSNREKVIETNRRERESTKTEMDRLVDELTATKRELEVLQGEVEDEKRASTVGDSILREYNTLRMAGLKNRVKVIIYFKEVGHVRYINTFITQFVQTLRNKKLKVKALIYDNRSSIKNYYDGIRSISGADFQIDKRTILAKAETYHVSEPNPAIIKETIQFMGGAEVLIIYDRMYNAKDIISGKEVNKYYVLNSKKEYDKEGKEYGIDSVNKIITSPGNSLTGRYMDVSTIEGYHDLSESAKISRYMKMAGSRTGNSIMNQLIEETGILDMLASAKK
jgi:hypothetical protein